MAEKMRFNAQFFEQILNSQGISRMCEERANAAAAIARRTAPVDSGDYQRGITVQTKKIGDRVSGLVVGNDWKTLLIESKTGNLARALRAAKRA